MTLVEHWLTGLYAPQLFMKFKRFGPNLVIQRKAEQKNFSSSATELLSVKEVD